ncbi:MAG TPA: FHA domain-containing protein [Acidimicrobiales bacterium]|nr:FHA domain-containing protein [Acidimicrobiales bacterium]
MPEPLLRLLQLFVVALVWLFFLRVLRAVWVEVRSTGAGGTAAPSAKPNGGGGRRAGVPRRKGLPRLVTVEPKERKGRVLDLKDEQTLGRAAGCTITLDDTYASQLHARVFTKDGQWFVEDLGSTNGTYLNAKRVSSPLAIKRGDRIKIGATVLEAEV